MSQSEFENLLGQLSEQELAPTPVLSYDDWLLHTAKELKAHPALQLLKGIMRGVQYVFARERAFFSILEEKGLWSSEDSAALEGKTVELSATLDKELIRSITRVASGGKLRIPKHDGTEIVVTPDAAVAAIQEFYTDTGSVSADTIKIFAELVGGGDADIEAAYKIYISELEKINASKLQLREAKRTALVKKLEIYESRCRLTGAVLPSEEDRQKMLSGELPIP